MQRRRDQWDIDVRKSVSVVGRSEVIQVGRSPRIMNWTHEGVQENYRKSEKQYVRKLLVARFCRLTKRWKISLLTRYHQPDLSYQHSLHIVADICTSFTAAAKSPNHHWDTYLRNLRRSYHTVSYLYVYRTSTSFFITSADTFCLRELCKVWREIYSLLYHHHNYQLWKLSYFTPYFWIGKSQFIVFGRSIPHTCAKKKRIGGQHTSFRVYELFV